MDQAEHDIPAAPAVESGGACIRLLASAAAAIMLVPAAVYNIAPGLRVALGGGEGASAAAALMAVQVAAVILIAALPKNRTRPRRKRRKASTRPSIDGEGFCGPLPAKTHATCGSI